MQMIRLIARRLMLPRGDTGEFSIPLLESATTSAQKVAIFSILDLINQKIIYQDEATIEGNIIKVIFTHEKTKNLPLGQYVWDIKLYTNPEYKNNKLINGEAVDSYYAGFTYPVCEITLARDKRVIE